MEGLSTALQQPEFVHVVLNHLPITGLLVGLVCLIVSVWLKGRTTLVISLGLIALLSLSAWPVAHYGERAHDRVLAMTDDVGAQYLKHHEELADRWIFLFYLTSVAAVGALVISWKWPRYFRPAAGVVALLAAASLAAGTVIADYGGRIRHREFRYGPPPSRDHDTREDSGEGSP